MSNKWFANSNGDNSLINAYKKQNERIGYKGNGSKWLQNLTCDKIITLKNILDILGVKEP